MKVCKVIDCNSVVVAFGNCDKHYRQIKKYGNIYKSNKDLTHKERFLSKIQINNVNECHEWIGGVDDCGYGLFYHDNKMTRSHRYQWELIYGNIPEGLHILHHCDNPKCCKINHLFIGTHQDNMDDRKNKNRGNAPKGEACGLTTHNESQVKEVKYLLKKGLSNVEISKKLNVSKSFILNIKFDRTWRHIQI